MEDIKFISRPEPKKVVMAVSLYKNLQDELDECIQDYNMQHADEGVKKLNRSSLVTHLIKCYIKTTK